MNKQYIYCYKCDEITEQSKLPIEYQKDTERNSYFCFGCSEIFNYLKKDSKVFEELILK